MAIANQGIRQDLNFSEIENEITALTNLSEVGLANDLKIIQNNLRNTSILAFNSVDTTTDEFVFSTDKTLTVTAGIGSVFANNQFEQATNLTINVDPAYDTYRGEVITVSGFVGTAATIFNGTYQTVNVGTGGTTITYRKNNCLFNGTGTASGSAQAVIKSGTNSVYTNDDIVGVSTNVSVGSTTLTAGTDYFICNSNTKDRFKLSTTPSAVGINTINITSTPSQFNFIRKEPVFKTNIEKFIRPEIQDENEFGSYLVSDINSVMESTQSNGENAEYFITKKYKGGEDTTVDTDIKTEGTVNLFDPVGFNANTSDLTDPKSPGIFIGNTRAFSADNNPWEPVSGAVGVAGTIRTDSYEVSIAELEFSNGLNIEGINDIAATPVDPTTFSHKIPVNINGETYYLLMKQS